jgi:hypothetical protein
MPEEKKNPVEESMEKDCIVLMAGYFILKALGGEETLTSVKCRGPTCGQYNTFNNKCGFSR